MPYQLLRFAFNKQYPENRMFRCPDQLKAHYDAVIIGAGGHGLATAYYLARDHNISNVAVLEKNYIGSGGTGRNTAIIRSNYLTAEGIRFYDESVRLFAVSCRDKGNQRWRFYPGTEQGSKRLQSAGDCTPYDWQLR